MTAPSNISSGRTTNVLCVTLALLLCISVFTANALEDTCFCGDECVHCDMIEMKTSDAAAMDGFGPCCSDSEAISADTGDCRSVDMSDVSMVTVRISGFDKTPAAGFAHAGGFLNRVQKSFPLIEDIPCTARSSPLYIHNLTLIC